MGEKYNLAVQKAGIGDLPLVVEIENKLFTEKEGRFEEKAYRWLIENPRDVRAYLSDDDIKKYDIDVDEEILNACVMLYYQGETPIGHGTIIVSKDPEGKRAGRIYSIGILKEYRRNFLGSLFMSKMEQALFLAGAEYVALETHASYDWWVKSLEKRGYKVTDTIEDYYADGDAVKMRKDLHG